MIYGGGKVLRFSPNGGVVGFVKLPTRCVTCTAFGGEDLFITSAADPYPESPEFPRWAELGGSVFRVSVDIKGRKINDWKELDSGSD
jgi:sugar lactone lactonase YvrE